MKMKMVVSFSALAGLALGASLAYGAAGSGGGGIVGSKHDMNVFVASRGGKADPAGRVCVFCHAPHHAEVSGTTDGGYNSYSPLWNHKLSEKTSFDPYISATFNPGFDKGKTGAIYDNMIGPSRLCMSCHDGATAADSYSGQLGSTTDKGDDAASIYGSGHFGIGLNGGLSNDHPVGFKYDDYQGQPFYELRDLSQQLPGNTAYKIDDLMFDDSTNALQNVMTCASCHDVHNGNMTMKGIKYTDRNYFLVQPNDQSQICLLCHAKDDKFVTTP